MSVNDLFNKANKLFINQDYFEGLQIYKEILAKYPKNTRLNEEDPNLKDFSKGNFSGNIIENV